MWSLIASLISVTVIVCGAVLALVVALGPLLQEYWGIPRLPRWWFAIAVFVAILGAVGKIVTDVRGQVAAAANERARLTAKNTGILRPARTFRLFAPTVEHPTIKMGDSEANLRFTGAGNVRRVQFSPEFFQEPRDLGDSEPIELWIENGEVRMRVVFRDHTGKELARIDGNVWHVKGGWDYNNNGDALEVVNRAVLLGESLARPDPAALRCVQQEWLRHRDFLDGPSERGGYGNAGLVCSR